jgi:hypothetical protein
MIDAAIPERLDGAAVAAQGDAVPQVRKPSARH